MNQEEIQKLLESVGKGGIQVNGDFVVSKHVEHEVNNVEAGGIGIQIVNGKKDTGNETHQPAGGDEQNQEIVEKPAHYTAKAIYGGVLSKRFH